MYMLYEYANLVKRNLRSYSIGLVASKGYKVTLQITKEQGTKFFCKAIFLLPKLKLVRPFPLY